MMRQSRSQERSVKGIVVIGDTDYILLTRRAQEMSIASHSEKTRQGT